MFMRCARGADSDSTKTTHLIVVCGWTAVEGKATTDDRFGPTVSTLKIVTDRLKYVRQSKAQFQTQCSAFSMHTIAYLIRVHQVPTLEMLNADCESLGADLSMMAHLGGAQYRADSTRVFGLFELWLCHTDWWTYSHRFEPMSKGLGVWLALGA
jgi:hypothetical protein